MRELGPRAAKAPPLALLGAGAVGVPEGAARARDPLRLVETSLSAVVQRFVSAIWVEESKANMRLSPSSSRNAQAVSVPKLGSVSVRAKRWSYALPAAGAGCSSASITVVPGVESNVPPHSLASRTLIRSGAVRTSRAPASAATSVVSRKGDADGGDGGSVDRERDRLVRGVGRLAEGQQQHGRDARAAQH